MTFTTTTKPSIMKKITLIDKNSRLHLPSGEVLICFHSSGDANTINSLNPNLRDLANALYDEREMGNIPSDTNVVYLPCGEKLDI